ncbi:hypothetical protein ACFSYG_05575 [Leeuwenhoekiella polynyae]|uniref:Uncharacterized protein n=1 Tax=Leeuwenhoekiella polynyae TaxID=1550906 RepID=A0A4Q0P3J5_9FLAO|nr:hypothetical protein [Leeuwenhoekiella polynyae]RXG20576.1 hypothetical protein DSM02_2429 [Leeuwenhoekiella polynyae]|tara:strand:+ start:1128 stop:1397 length:270 start_codon:yes stop_codon:yes gene_type:complete
MNGSLDQFKATLQRRRERQEKHSGHRKDVSGYKIAKSGFEFDSKKLKPAELEKYRQTLKLRKQNRILKQWVIFIAICILITLIVLIYNL